MENTEKDIVKDILDYHPGYYRSYERQFSLVNKIDIPTNSGLYMLAQKVMPFNFNEEIIYLIKIGKSRNLYRRLSGYKSMNPSAQCIAYIVLPLSWIDSEEQRILNDFAAQHIKIAESEEWFIVSKEKFEFLCKNKFSEYFTTTWKIIKIII